MCNEAHTYLWGGSASSHCQIISKVFPCQPQCSSHEIEAEMMSTESVLTWGPLELIMGNGIASACLVPCGPGPGWDWWWSRAHVGLTCSDLCGRRSVWGLALGSCGRHCVMRILGSSLCHKAWSILEHWMTTKSALRAGRKRKVHAIREEQGVPDEFALHRPTKEDGRDQISINFVLVLSPARVMNRLVRR